MYPAHARKNQSAARTAPLTRRLSARTPLAGVVRSLYSDKNGDQKKIVRVSQVSAILISSAKLLYKNTVFFLCHLYVFYFRKVYTFYFDMFRFFYILQISMLNIYKKNYVTYVQKNLIHKSIGCK